MSIIYSKCDASLDFIVNCKTDLIYSKAERLSEVALRYWSSIMSVVRKVVLNKNLVKVHKFFGIIRNVHLTAAEANDPFIIKCTAEDVEIPNITIPEIIIPKFEAYKNFTAVVSVKHL